MAGIRSAVVLTVVAVLLAGCTLGAGGADPVAPTAPATPTPDVWTVPLENSSLDLDAETVFARVEALVGEDVESPPVEVLRGSGAGSGAFGYPYTPYGFVEDLGLTEVGEGGTSAAGLTDSFGNVYLVPSAGNHEALIKVLVHEYVHVVQFRADLLPWDQRELLGDLPTDTAQTRLALVEGAAVWVTDAYTRRHQPANVSLQSDRMAHLYRNGSVGTRYFLARYHFGYRGIDQRIDSPDQLRALYATDVPNTTEQFLHGYGPAEEPPRRFAIDFPGETSRDFLAEASEDQGWRIDGPQDEDVMGELFIRVALSRNLSFERAADAADGWGYDRLVAYERNDTAGYVWVTRWDDAANATAFENAFETYADRRSTGPEQTFRVDRVAPEFVVVYSGPLSFVERASASRTAEGVRVGVGS